jgi:hypothetical protein
MLVLVWQNPQVRAVPLVLVSSPGAPVLPLPACAARPFLLLREIPAAKSSNKRAVVNFMFMYLGNDVFIGQ